MSNYGTTATTSHTRPYQGFPYTNPTITDVPSINRTDQWANLPRKPINPPKLHVNIPDSRPGNDDCDTPDYVSDTILYNPFEDRRINIETPTPEPIDNNQSSETRSNNHNKTPSITSDTSSEDNAPRIYIPPGPRDELGGPSIPNRNPTLPGFMSKEASIYQPNNNDDGFPLSPIPVSEFPEPPPAYSEIDRIGQQQDQNQTSPLNVVEQPPRTQVILPDNIGEAAAAFNADRKNLKCPHCDRQVDTVVYRQSGIATHVAAFILFFIFFPITIFIYCTDYCKYKNHYCPDCGMLVGYEIPMTCQDFVFAEKKPA